LSSSIFGVRPRQDILGIFSTMAASPWMFHIVSASRRTAEAARSARFEARLPAVVVRGGMA